jgi:hypothetical protein
MKNLLNLGKALNKAEQKQIFGGDTSARIKQFPGEGNECIDGSCANMPNPNHPYGSGPAFIQGICNDGGCSFP